MNCPSKVFGEERSRQFSCLSGLGGVVKLGITAAVIPNTGNLGCVKRMVRPLQHMNFDWFVLYPIDLTTLGQFSVEFTGNLHQWNVVLGIRTQGNGTSAIE